jgi:soluble lytic murein transglycosylase-like protein
LIDALISAAAKSHALPESLIAALVRVESGGDPWAVRYEPLFYDRYCHNQPVIAKPPCTLATERRLRACSFGLMQIMGQTARERGFTGTFLTSLCDPETNLDMGCRHLTWLCQRYFDRDGWDGVIAAYNAGSPRPGKGGWKFENQPYVDKVRKALGGGL